MQAALKSENTETAHVLLSHRACPWLEMLSPVEPVNVAGPITGTHYCSRVLSWCRREVDGAFEQEEEGLPRTLVLAGLADLACEDLSVAPRQVTIVATLEGIPSCLLKCMRGVELAKKQHRFLRQVKPQTSLHFTSLLFASLRLASLRFA